MSLGFDNIFINRDIVGGASDTQIEFMISILEKSPPSKAPYKLEVHKCYVDKQSLLLWCLWAGLDLCIFMQHFRCLGCVGEMGGGELTLLVTVLISTSLSSDIDCVGQDEGPHHHHC